MTGEYDRLIPHVGHRLECVTYLTYSSSSASVANVAIECVTCHELLVDADGHPPCKGCGDHVALDADGYCAICRDY